MQLSDGPGAQNIKVSCFDGLGLSVALSLNLQLNFVPVTPLNTWKKVFSL